MEAKSERDISITDCACAGWCFIFVGIFLTLCIYEMTRGDEFFAFLYGVIGFLLFILGLVGFMENEKGNVCLKREKEEDKKCLERKKKERE